jgi:hypothetical protein
MAKKIMNGRPVEARSDEDYSSMPALFKADFAAWLNSRTPQERELEAVVRWTDLGPFTRSIYAMHRDLIASYQYLAHKGKAPTVLPVECTPAGFYVRAVTGRRLQLGMQDPFTPTPFGQLSEFSHFIYRRLTDRVARSAGFGVEEMAVDDGLGSGLNDGQGDGLEDGL